MTELADVQDLGAVTSVKKFAINQVKAGSSCFYTRIKQCAPPRFPRRVKTEGNKIATGSPAAHICGRGGIGRLDGFRFRYLSGVRVRVPPPAPKREAKKDIEDKTSVFSRLPRPVDQQIYGPYFSDILPCAIHSGRSRTHTIFTLSGISFEAGILLLQDLGLFYSAV